MGILFAKKNKDNLTQSPPIRKSRVGSVPKRVPTNANTSSANSKPTTTTSSQPVSGGGPGVGAGLSPTFKMVDRQQGIQGFSNPSSVGNPSSSSTPSSAMSPSSSSSQTPNASGPQTISTLERVVNIHGISMALFNITRALVNVTDWSDPIFITLMEKSMEDLTRELVVVMDASRLKDWTQPMHFRKTGSVQGAGKRLASTYKEFVDVSSKIKTGSVGVSDQRSIKESLKELVRSYINFVNAIEQVSPGDFTTEINEIARTLRDVVDTAGGKLNFVFDDVARICTTYSVRLSRLGIWKGLQTENLSWSRILNDTCFTITKATKVLYVVGLKCYDNPNDQNLSQNLNALTKGMVTQMKKLQSHSQTDPPPQKSSVITFTPEVIQEHLTAYDQGVKEVANSLSVFVKNNNDATVSNSIHKIISQLEIIKNSVKSPDAQGLLVAVGSIAESLEKFCGSVYYNLHDLGEENEVIREQIMETMQHAIHCSIHLQLVAITKSLQFTVINPESTMLTAVRAMLLNVSLILDAVDYMRVMKIIPDVTGNSTALGQGEINAALVYILHYGRALFKGDEGDFEFEVPTERTTPEYLGQQFPVQDDFDGEAKTPRGNHNTPTPMGNSSTASTSTIKPSSGTTTNFSSAPAPSVMSPRGPGVKIAGTDLTEDDLVKINPDDYNEDNLPPGFEPSPPKPQYKTGSSEEEYKAYMVRKYEYETWQNKLILCKIKLKKHKEEAAKKQ